MNSQIINKVNDNSIILSKSNDSYNKSYDQYKDIYVELQQILSDDTLYSKELDINMKGLLDNYIEKLLLLYKVRDVEFV